MESEKDVAKSLALISSRCSPEKSTHAPPGFSFTLLLADLHHRLAVLSIYFGHGPSCRHTCGIPSSRSSMRSFCAHKEPDMVPLACANRDDDPNPQRVTRDLGDLVAWGCRFPTITPLP